MSDQPTSTPTPPKRGRPRKKNPKPPTSGPSGRRVHADEETSAEQRELRAAAGRRYQVLTGIPSSAQRLAEFVAQRLRVASVDASLRNVGWRWAPELVEDLLDFLERPAADEGEAMVRDWYADLEAAGVSEALSLAREPLLALARFERVDAVGRDHREALARIMATDKDAADVLAALLAQLHVVVGKAG